MSGLIVTCRQCFAEYEVDRADILKGHWWWSLCPECRPETRPEQPTDQGADAS